MKQSTRKRYLQHKRHCRKGIKGLAAERKDLSEFCDGDDENMDNDCWHCQYFLFPIGCMYGEETIEKAEKGD